MNPLELVKELEAKRDEFNTTRSQAQLEADTSARCAEVVAQRISVINMATRTLASLPPLGPEEAWRGFLIAARKTLCDELMAMPARIRSSHDLGVQQNLKLSIVAIDRGPGVTGDTGYLLDTLRLGQLMREAGYSSWFGSLPEVEDRIERLVQQRADAQARLDEALLDDEARATRDAETAARLAKLNAGPVRKVRHDGSMFDRYPDGRVVEITS
jgi:hypothetical protein